MSTTTNITATRRHSHPSEFYPRFASSRSTTTALRELRSAIEHEPRQTRRLVVGRQTHPTVVSDIALGSLVFPERAVTVVNTRLIGLPFGQGESRMIELAGWLPVGVTAAVLDVTVFNARTRGTVAIWRSDRPRPCEQAFVYDDARTQHGTAICSVPPNGRVTIRLSSEADLIVRIAGWCAPDPAV